MRSPMAPYHTLEELTGQKVTFAEFLSDLSVHPRSDVISFIAGVSAILERNEANATGQQIRLLNTVTPPDFASNIRVALERLNLPFGALFHRRQLWLLLQFAVLGCKDRFDGNCENHELSQIGICGLKANDLLKKIERLKPVPQSSDALGYLIALLITHVDIYYGEEVIARAWLFWLEMEGDASIQKLKKQVGIQQSLDEIFEKAYGIRLRELLNFVTVLYFTFSASSDNVSWPTPSMYDSTSNFRKWFSDEHIKAGLKLLSATPEELSIRLLGSSRHSWATDSTSLIQSPLIEIEDNKYVCPDLHMLRAFYMQRVFELLNDAMDTGQFRQLMGGLFERYVERLILSFAPIRMF